MGVSILRGIISSQSTRDSSKASPKSGFTENKSSAPFFSHFIACVNRPESVPMTQGKLSGTASSRVEVWQGRNVEAVRNADVILLSCQPSQAAEVLADAGMARALSGKILLSICVGLTGPQVNALIVEDGSGGREGDSDAAQSRPVIVHAMPNTASTIGESSTIISENPEHSTAAVSQVVQHVFSSIGKIITVPDNLMSAASVTAASTPAFFALALEGVIQGAMTKGIPRPQATVMAAQAMKGAAGLVLQGEDPKDVMANVMTPQGCTERGVHVLQGNGVDSSYAKATIAGIERVFEMSRERDMSTRR